MELFKYDLDERACEHIQYVLEYDSGFCRTLVERLDFSRGKAFTYLPDRIEKIQLYQFSHGGILRKETKEKSLTSNKGVNVAPVSSLNKWAAEYISNYISGESCYAFFEDAIAKENDPHVAQLSANTKIVSEEVYFLVSGSQTNLKDLEEVVKATNLSWHFLCGLCYSATNERNVLELKKMSLDTVVSELEVLVIGAYDGEGFLVWERPR